MDANDGYRRFEYADGSSCKFWEIKVTKTGYKVRYGRIGATPRQELEKGIPAMAEKLIRSKTNKGYVEVTFTWDGETDMFGLGNSDTFLVIVHTKTARTYKIKMPWSSYEKTADLAKKVVGAEGFSFNLSNDTKSFTLPGDSIECIEIRD